MNTNVEIIGQGSKGIPAGIFVGTEVFVKDSKIYAMYNGQLMFFEDLPSQEKRCFVDKYMEDLSGRFFIQNRMGISGFESGFKQWLFCKFGAMDRTPDYLCGEVIPDRYNSACQRTECAGRGVLCGVECGLKSYEVETLKRLKDGKTLEEVAAILCVAVPTVKSRIRKLKRMFNVSNLVALVSMATDLGL